MNELELIKAWLLEHPTTTMVIKYVVWVLFIFLLLKFLRRTLKKNLSKTDARYKSQKIIEVIGYVLLLILTLSYFTGNIKDFTLAIGLLTAGITITLQELILSVAGSLFIFFVKVYKPGDRIEINGIKGDVIDVNSMYTTMMEIGQWVSSDNYSGRIVKLSNAFIFKGPVYNYSQDFPFIWDEFDLPIRYGSDIPLAKSIVIKVAQDILSEYVQESVLKWKDVVAKYYIEDAKVDPTLAITLTDNWVKFNLRYIVDYKRRRATKDRLNELIRIAFEKTEGKVQLASMTVELVRIPTVAISSEKGPNSES